MRTQRMMGIRMRTETTTVMRQPMRMRTGIEMRKGIAMWKGTEMRIQTRTGIGKLRGTVMPILTRTGIRRRMRSRTGIGKWTVRLKLIRKMTVTEMWMVIGWQTRMLMGK